MLTEQDFEEILIKYQHVIFSVAFRMVFSRETANDIAQESFIKLWQNQKKLKKGKPVYPFLIKIAINKSIDHLRSKKQANSLQENDLIEKVDKNIENDELADILLKCTSHLKPKQRAVFILRDLEGLSFIEICEILKTDLHNIRSNLHLARKNIKEKLFTQFQITEDFFYEM